MVIHLGLPAYVGPGAGFAFLGSLLSLVSAVLAGIASVLLWPFRIAWLTLRRPQGTRGRKAIFLGFEGLGPVVTERMMAEGKLPNLARLREMGSYRRLRSTFPALSSVAWSTFATGANPAKHGVFDAAPAERRKIDSFWKILGRHAVRSTILWVPGATVPEAFHGRELAAGPEGRSYPRYYSRYLAKLFGSFAREPIFLDALEKTRRGVLACVFELTEPLYENADRIVGEALAHIDRDAALFVISDHGVRAVQRTVDLNGWLIREGYLALEAGSGSIDWTRTRAYARGRAGVYLNLRGREANGIVDPGEASLLRTELARKLLGLRDETTGEVAIQSAYPASDLYQGPHLNAAPDVVISSPDPALVPGVLFSNLKITVDDPGIEDMAPTALSLFGVQKPAGMEGRPVVAAA